LLITSAGFCWAVVLIWSPGFGRALARKAHVSRLGMTRWVAFPVVMAICLTLVALHVPQTVRFNLSRAELQAAATRDAGGTHLPGWIGLMPVDAVFRDEDGTTTFWLSGDDNLVGFPCGLIYVPRGDPPQGRGDLGRQVADHWWTWCEND
jgi:hypothetical protein